MSAVGTPRRYNDLNSWLRGRFGRRVQKLTIDAGLSCPNRDGSVGVGGCTYCNAKGSGTGAWAQGLSVSEQLRGQIDRQRVRYGASAFIAYFQSFSNTYADVETLRRLYDEALAVEGVVGLSIGTRPDCLGTAVLELLEGYARRCMVWLELGLQSAHDVTLARINRGHSAETFADAAAAAHEAGLLVCAHAILGLPGEDRGMMRRTAEVVRSLGIDGVKLHLLYVVRGTPMEQLYLRGEYRCLEREEYADLACDVLERLPWSVVVQRLTGDPHADELVAPQWALEKTRNRAAIEERLVQRDTWQGRLAGAPPP